ncbi:MAG TPA: hypothetical protein VIF88_12310, partial [Methylocystis sp.]
MRGDAVNKFDLGWRSDFDASPGLNKPSYARSPPDERAGLDLPEHSQISPQNHDGKAIAPFVAKIKVEGAPRLA